ncbi:DNA cytosine methyltransferase [Rhodovulum sulfidophilum]|uniref:DNA cytosine methyltransferase n=1 Tax=Rhodovulum sulfidophilum TaxID=35806 RepID=UPI001922A9FD|nr:DNA cytosine methyltransferase [Rhodovulum sulfidophilum]MBL3594828.1 DNA cytosine methyltransferase [Rhodovulum sulfidophilum]
MVTAIDLFSGCGGLSLGAARAGLHPTVAVELDKHAFAAHKLNFPTCRSEQLDLSSIDAQDIKRSYIGQPDILFGGPPCQGFSYMGRRVLDDPRNELLRRFFHFVNALKPRVFVMENVPGLLAEASVELLQAAISSVAEDYEVLPPVILDAARFGAATKRRRVIVIGYIPAAVPPILIQDILNEERGAVCVDQALASLPEPGDHDIVEVTDTNPNDYVKHLNRRIPSVGDPCAIADFERGLVSGFIATKHTPDVEARFGRTLPGATETVSRLHRLAPNEAARTLRAGTGPDRGSFQSARPIHFSSNRVITVREAARIQGFPDWFRFHPTKWHSHRMIGNSVSPIFAEALMTPIAKALGVKS